MGHNITFSSKKHPPLLIRANFPVRSTSIALQPSEGALAADDVATIPAVFTLMGCPVSVTYAVIRSENKSSFWFAQ
jgi:hypothetical protein